jgi:hypothetical protein
VVVNVGTQGESHSAEDCVRGLIDLRCVEKNVIKKLKLCACAGTMQIRWVVSK